MKKFYLLTAILFFISCKLTYAQLQFNAEVRPRAEMRDGYKQLSDTLSLPAFFVSQRSRLSVALNREKYTLYLAIQDIRVWGDELDYSSTGIRGDKASIDLKEAWFNYYFSDRFSIKIGRQELKYADQRLLGNRNWNQHGMSYDALLFKFNGNFICDVGFSYNNNNEIIYQEAFALDKMKTLNFIYLHKQWNDRLTSSLVYVLSGFQKPDRVEKIYLKNTPGILLDYNPSPFKLSGSGYYQFGHNSSGANVSAYFWNLRSEISFSNSSLAMGIDYISGHNFASEDSSYLKKDHLFDILYGARHRYYGNMDYFSNFQKGTAGGGLIDAYFDSKFDIGPNIFIAATYHYFRLQNNILDAEQGSTLDKNLANEIDFSFSYKPSKDIKIETGYALILSSESLNKIQKISSTLPRYSHYIWIMCTVTPSFSFK